MYLSTDVVELVRRGAWIDIAPTSIMSAKQHPCMHEVPSYPTRLAAVVELLIEAKACHPIWSMYYCLISQLDFFSTHVPILARRRVVRLRSGVSSLEGSDDLIIS